jgi:rhamnosyltransferase
MATRNGAATIERQMRSVLMQSDVEIRVEVRDDSSSDGTRELVAAIACNDHRISLRTDHDASGSAASNFFRLISGAQLEGITHVAFSDQDDEWHVGKLARAVAVMTQTSSSGYSASTEAIWPDGRRKVLSQSPNIRVADYLFEGAGQGCTFVLAVELFRKLQIDLAQHSPLLTNLRYHDWTIYALARTSGARWHFDALPSMLYYQHSGNDTGARNSVLGVLRRIALIRSGWYRAQVDGMISLLLEARPTHEAALQWHGLSRRGLKARLLRLIFVIQNGRRKLVDRVIQATAVLAGYL